MHNKMLLLMLSCTFFGVLFGIFFPEQMLSFRWLDSLFIDLLKLTVLPLIFFSIVSSIISMGGVKRFKKIWIFTLGYTFVSVSIAIFIEMVLSNVFAPGVGVSSQLIALQPRPRDIGLPQVSAILNILFPPQILAAAKNFEITPLVIFSIVFSSACLFAGESAKNVVSAFIGMRNIFNIIIRWITYITPFGLFILLGSAIAEAYTHHSLFQSMLAVLFFICIFILGLVLQFLWQLAIVVLIFKKESLEYILTSTRALLTVLATSSTLNALPIALDVAKEQNIDDDVANFVLPFTSTINLSGPVLYEAMAALFFCQILGIELSIPTQIGIFFTAIIAGLGTSGVDQGGLVTMTIVLRSVLVPSSAIALLAPFDHLLERLRAIVCVWGNLVCAATVNYLLTKEAGVTRMNPTFTDSSEALNATGSK